MNKKFKQIEIFGVLFGVIIGTLLHFSYWLAGNNKIVGLFSAVNESVWEHTKLFFFPVLIFMLIEWYFTSDKKTLLLAKVLETLTGIIFIVSFFYTYTNALGLENIWIDITSFIIAVIIGKAISYYVISSKFKFQGYISLHALVIFLLLTFYFVATFIPPKTPLFLDHEKGTYGISEPAR